MELKTERLSWWTQKDFFGIAAMSKDHRCSMETFKCLWFHVALGQREFSRCSEATQNRFVVSNPQNLLMKTIQYFHRHHPNAAHCINNCYDKLKRQLIINQTKQRKPSTGSFYCLIFSFSIPLHANLSSFVLHHQLFIFLYDQIEISPARRMSDAHFFFNKKLTKHDLLLFLLRSSSSFHFRFHLIRNHVWWIKSSPHFIAARTRLSCDFHNKITSSHFVANLSSPSRVFVFIFGR